MKKFLKLISVICLVVLASFAFVACDEEAQPDLFYEETNKVFSEFVTDICLNAEYNSGVVYGTSVNGVLAKIESNEYKVSEYAQLTSYTELKTVYDKIFTSSFYFLSSFDGVFLVAPAEIPGGMKSDYQDFEKLVNKTKQDIKEFHTTVEALDRNILTSTVDKAVSSISLQHLREYKRKLIDLCEEVMDVDNTFLDLIRTYIYPKYETFRENGGYIELSEVQIQNQKTLANLQSVIDTITPAIKYLNAFNGDYVKLATDQLFETLNAYLSLDNKQQGTATVAELQTYLEVYTMYKNDVKCFEDSLNSINMTTFRLDYNFNKEEYAKEDPSYYAYVTKIFEFTSTSCVALYNVNKTLCESEG